MSGEPVGRFEWEQALRETPGISLPLRGVLSLMATHADFETGESIKPSLTKMAKRLEVSRRTLTKHVAKASRSNGWDAPRTTVCTVRRASTDSLAPRGVSQILRTPWHSHARGVSQILRTPWHSHARGVSQILRRG